MRRCWSCFTCASRSGLEGRYAGKPNGRAELDALAARLLERVRSAPARARPMRRTLSQHWAGEKRRGPALHGGAAVAHLVVGAALVLAR